MIKRLLPLAATLLLIASCSAPDEPAPESKVETTTSTPSSSSSTTSAASSTTEPTNIDEQNSEQEPSTDTLDTEAAESQEPSAPYIVECLFGTPGPSLMSDGSIQTTDFCVNRPGAQEIRDAEAWYNSPDNPALQEYYAEQERLSNIPYAEGGTCPAYLCGYGTNDQGQRNPSSGELQAVRACETGYITDAEWCESVEWVKDHEY